MSLESGSINFEQQNKDLNELLRELSQIKQELAAQQGEDLLNKGDGAEIKIAQLEAKTNKLLSKQESNSEQFFNGIDINEIQKDVEMKEIYTHHDEKLRILRNRINQAKKANITPQGKTVTLDERFNLDEAIIDRDTPIAEIQQVIQRGRTSGFFSNVLANLGIKDLDNTQSV